MNTHDSLLVWANQVAARLADIGASIADDSFNGTGLVLLCLPGTTIQLWSGFEDGPGTPEEYAEAVRREWKSQCYTGARRAFEAGSVWAPSRDVPVKWFREYCGHYE